MYAYVLLVLCTVNNKRKIYKFSKDFKQYNEHAIHTHKYNS